MYFFTSWFWKHDMFILLFVILITKADDLFRSPCRSSTNLLGRNISSSSDLTLCEQIDGIRIVTLNNPQKRNCLSLAMLESIQSRLTDEPALKCVIVRSTGPVFSSGHDLKEMTTECGRKQHESVFKLCTEVMLGLQNLAVPVIAEVRGLATAAGCQFIASCDMVVASEQAKFATPGVKVGLFCSTPGIAVARAVPRKVAMDLLLTGRPVSAEAALQWGLVSRVVPHGRLEEETMALGRRVCESSKAVNALGKRFFYQQINMRVEDAYRAGSSVMCDNLQLVDGQEGIKAFVGKRLPVWIHTDDKV